MARTLLERNQEILARVHNLGPMADQIRDLFVRGKREHLREGADASGHLFRPLAPSTLQRPRMSPTPLLPNGENSRLITGYHVEVSVQSKSLIVSAGWPGLDWVQYHKTGTRHMPRRDPGGFREQDKRQALGMLRDYIFAGG